MMIMTAIGHLYTALMCTHWTHIEQVILYYYVNKRRHKDLLQGIGVESVKRGINNGACISLFLCNTNTKGAPDIPSP